MERAIKRGSFESSRADFGTRSTSRKIGTRELLQQQIPMSAFDLCKARERRFLSDLLEDAADDVRDHPLPELYTLLRAVERMTSPMIRKSGSMPSMANIPCSSAPAMPPSTACSMPARGASGRGGAACFSKGKGSASGWGYRFWVRCNDTDMNMTTELENKRMVFDYCRLALRRAAGAPALYDGHNIPDERRCPRCSGS